MLSSVTSLGLDLERVAQNVGAGFTRAYLHGLYPNEFEYYLFSLELVDPNGSTKEMLIFPVTPTSVQDDRASLVNIKKTNNSIVSLINTSFAPTTINLSGTFGRKIRILLGADVRQGVAFTFQENLNVGNTQTELNGEIKTGYGVTKILERIVKNSQKEEGNLLFLYNLALNNNYLVECTNMSFSMSMENNAFWNYNLIFRSLAYAEDVYPGGSEAQKQKIKEMMKYDNINKAIFGLTEALKGLKAVRNEALINVAQKLKK